VLCLWAYLNYLSNWFLQFWIRDYPDNSDVKKFVGFSGAILAATSASKLIRSLVMMAGSLDSSRKINFEMLFSLCFASLNKFFDKIPIGRVLNRFSKDAQIVDLKIFNQVDKLCNYS